MNNELNLAIDNLCNRFGVTVDYLFPKLVHYIFTMSLIGTIVGFIFTIVAVLVIIMTYRSGKKWAEEQNWNATWDDKSTSIPVVCIAATTIVIAITGMLINLVKLISVIVSPEMAAIKYICNML